ncbi:1-phenyl-1, 2-ethanediol dehydrogenase [Spathaspora passalidarum NRRL Y-27907]|uniref:1-phenyl-1, 2-ethanediol dehydrogenase n=1 Tax=Spathaspora passalidarum (strain NRRL Y-27907 / 11-Y1) TaxID=619300 RepID=G3AIH2_SPAPN|nr:1-phenyl-1, 2-ethanediol dehydrogenase [Spathaspora passalidarum NRRL Y-27907]EGW34442.1 1-phenyl-1, 2-ethanediol dehydrogenase [Spathaspora passalidarum NRRL Y-27907]
MSIPDKQYGFFYTKADGLKLKEDLPVGKPGPGQLLLKVDAVGLCHSDLHIIYEGLDCGDNYVMGHEIAGSVAALGPETVGFKIGERVACVGPNGCGICRECRAGLDNVCKNAFLDWFGLGYNGGYEQYLLVKRPRNLVRIPDNVTSDQAAAITDAVLTPYHAVKLAGINPTSNVLIIGAGGLGINGIQIAKAFGAKITVLDKKEEARKIVKELGVSVYESLPSDVQPGSFDVCLDFVVVQPTFDLCQKYTKPKGIIIPVGLGAPKVSFDLGDLALREINILGSFWGTSNDLEEAFELVSKGLVTPKVAKAPLKELPTYIKKLKNNEYEGRVVFNP